MKQVLFFGLVAAVAFTSCKKSTTDKPTTVSGTKTISVAFDPKGEKNFTLFRFSDSSIVANTDSASTGNNKWDFGLRFATFIVNSASSGPGNAGVILQDGIFDAITTAPTSNYAYDTTKSQRAIKPGTWYDYNAQTFAFTPKAGKVFIFKTADGAHYAKLELLSVTYPPFTGPFPTALLYKFRFVYQSNGSTTF